MAAKVTVEEVRKAQRAEGPATVLAIGTVTPPNCVYQADYPDYYFRVTKSEHMTELKEKFRRICRKSMIQKRYMHLTEDILLENPNMASYSEPSLNARQDILVEEVPKLGAAAAEKAIKEWGLPRSQITHVIFCTTSGVEMPGADSKVIKLLGLSPSVKRVMLYHQGCFAGGMVLRIAKDLAENNRGARVLIVCSEITVVTFRGPLRGSPRLAGWAGSVWRWCGRGDRGRGPYRPCGAAIVSDGFSWGDHSPKLGRCHRRAPSGGWAHLPPPG
ncbi:unnamed protein product [Urochloa decumbens]|uniref:Chalcone/stilbene synthase N-terminal domain-containing protein n=1 Tax=Urochloa decumbens TaxID=240449 RepID=A0ABC9CG45_9POAL